MNVDEHKHNICFQKVAEYKIKVAKNGNTSTVKYSCS